MNDIFGSPSDLNLFKFKRANVNDVTHVIYAVKCAFAIFLTYWALSHDAGSDTHNIRARGNRRIHIRAHPGR